MVDPYRIVFEASATLTASLELDEVLAAVARQTAEALDVQYCDINEYDALAGTLTEVAVWTPTPQPDEEAYVGTVLPVGKRPSVMAVLEDRVLLEEYVDDPALAEEERELMRTWGEFASLEAPLVLGEETLGIICIAERADRARRFNDDDRRLLRLLASPAAIAIHNAREFRARAERTRRLGTLLDATRAITTTLDIDEVLLRVNEAAVQVADASQSAVYEYHAEADAIVYRSVHKRWSAPDAAPDDELGTLYPLAEYPGERAMLEDGVIVVEHESDADLPADRRASLAAWGEKTVLTIPLAVRGEPLGILRVCDMTEERDFDPAGIDLMRSLGELASAAIHNARLFRAQDRQRARLLDLLQASRALSSTFVLDEVVGAVEEGLRRLFGAGGEVWLRAGEAGFAPAAEVAEWAATAATGEPEGPPARPVPAPAREALARGGPVESADASAATLVVPIVARDRAEGFIRVVTSAARSFRADERETLQVLANLAAVALANAALYRQEQEQAIRDGLTGLYNQRHFRERLQQECARARRYGLPLSLLMIDVDDFKRYNDEHGHQMGDEVLREVGRIMASGVRRGVDVPARYGGEEFAVILPHTSLWGAQRVGRRLREAVEDLEEGLPPAGTGAVTVGERLRETVAAKAFAGRGGRRYARLTVSIGVAALDEGECAAERLIEEADQALYVAKRRGKNRTEVYEP